VEMFDPLDLALDAVNARLFPGCPGHELPATWRPWKQPTAPLPLDEFISEMVGRLRAPRLRSPDELARYHLLGKCPYALARAEVARAALQAFLLFYAHRDEAEATAAMTRAAKELIPDLRAQIATTVDHFFRIIEAQEYAFEPELDKEIIPLRREAEYLSDRCSALANIEAELTRMYVRRSQTRGNVWRIGFASTLFSAWWQLTGRDPGTSDLFIRFLDAAWQSLSEEELPALNWESAINTARDRMWKERRGEAPWRIDGRVSQLLLRAPSSSGIDSITI
jgi:hypothetical protein